MILSSQELGRKWWHRLFKVLFILISITLLVSSITLFYDIEKPNAREYQVIKTFAEYVEEQPFGFSSYKIPEGFGALDGGVGCLDNGGKVSYILPSVLDDISCINLGRSAPGKTSCDIPPSLCKADASRIVNYTVSTDFDFGNYLNIGLKVLFTVGTWMLLVHLLYYKAFLYIVYGSKEKENSQMDEHKTK